MRLQPPMIPEDLWEFTAGRPRRSIGFKHHGKTMQPSRQNPALPYHGQAHTTQECENTFSVKPFLF